MSCPVPPLAESAKQLLHTGDEIGLRNFQQQMEVISHENPSVDFPTLAHTDLAKKEEKRLPVIVGYKYVFASIAAGNYMVDRVWILKSRLSRHAPT